MIARIAIGPRPSNRPRSTHAALRVADELQEIRRPEIAALAPQHREAIDARQAIPACRSGRRRGDDDAAGGGSAASAAAAVDASAPARAREDLAIDRRDWRRRRDHAQRPRDGHGERREARAVVARLIAEPAAKIERAWRDRRRQRQFDGHHELVREHGQRLALPDLREVDGGRIDDVRHRDAGRGVDRQRGRNQALVARLIRLHVERLGQRHHQGHTCGSAGPDAVGLDDRPQFGAGPALRRGRARRRAPGGGANQEQEQAGEDRAHHGLVYRVCVADFPVKSRAPPAARGPHARRSPAPDPGRHADVA